MSANLYPCTYVGRPDIGVHERVELRPERRPELRPKPLLTPWSRATAEQIIADILRFKRYGDVYYGITTGESA